MSRSLAFLSAGLCSAALVAALLWSAQPEGSAPAAPAERTVRYEKVSAPVRSPAPAASAVAEFLRACGRGEGDAAAVRAALTGAPPEGPLESAVGGLPLRLTRGVPFADLGTVFLYADRPAEPPQLVVRVGDEFFAFGAGSVLRPLPERVDPAAPAGACVSDGDDYGSADPLLLPATAALGELHPTDLTGFDVVVLNRRDGPVRLAPPTTTCGCVSVRSAPEGLSAGAAGVVRLTAVPALAKSRTIDQRVRVGWTANDAAGTATAGAAGALGGVAEVTPAFVTINLSGSAAGGEVRFRVAVPGETITDVRPRFLPEGLELAETVSSPDGSAAVRLLADPAALAAGRADADDADDADDAGPLAAAFDCVTARLGGDAVPASLRIVADRPPWFDLRPAALYLGTVAPGAAAPAEFRSARDVRLIFGDEPGLSLRGLGGGTYRLTFPCPAEPGPFRGRVAVTDGRRTSEVTVAGLVAAAPPH